MYAVPYAGVFTNSICILFSLVTLLSTSNTLSPSSNSASVSERIMPVSYTHLDPDLDKRFIKDGKSLIDNLLSYQLKDGSFEHTKGGGSNIMATEQALCALEDVYKRQIEFRKHLQEKK